MPFAYDLCVVGGAGHVGLPFALAFAEAGLRAAIYDKNKSALERISSGVVPFMEQGAEPLLRKALAENRLAMSDAPTIVGESRVVIITIGTPVDEFFNPVFKDIRNCLAELKPFLREGQVLVLRSTVYPGTTEWCARWLRENGLNIPLAYCPERVVQGKSIEEIKQLPQIIGGTTPEGEQEALDLFKKISVETYLLKPIEAEFAKLFTNAYRYIHFAIANQFYMIAASAGVDYPRLLAGMKFHYPRLEGLPSPGFSAGPCLLKDTMQLNAFAKNQFDLGAAAMNINEGLVMFLVDRMSAKWDLKEKTIGILGMAFKPENDDTRAALSYKLKKVLEFNARRVLTTDPFVHTDPALLPLDQVIRESDLLILAIPHRAYKNIDLKGKPVFDVWGYLAEGSFQ
jgi:UDP-N-acetyl-D-mannosaminuronic acid dehydrogenase